VGGDVDGARAVEELEEGEAVEGDDFGERPVVAGGGGAGGGEDGEGARGGRGAVLSGSAGGAFVDHRAY
jgi:hypothetical protein